MATIKAFTDISQSKKLAEILPLESADMYYFRQIDNDYFPPNVESICPIPLYRDGKEDFNYDIRCWSLAALLDAIPFNVSFNKAVYRFKLVKFSDCWECYHENFGTVSTEIFKADNPVDACYKMILKLHELYLL